MTPSMGSTLHIKDELDLAASFLTPEALATQKKSAMTQVVVEGDTVYMCTYFAKHVPDTEADKLNTCKQLAKVINELTNNNLIHSTLAPISSMKLAETDPFQKPAIVVFTFVLVPSHKLEDIREQYTSEMVKEGEIPNKEGNFEIETKEGEFFASIRVYGKDEEQVSSLVESEIETYLQILPKGTQVVSKRTLAPLSLYLETEVKFFNPLLSKVKYITLNYIRDCIEISGEIQVFNILQSITYLDKNKNPLYT
jgi:hypothetical protein